MGLHIGYSLHIGYKCKCQQNLVHFQLWLIP